MRENNNQTNSHCEDINTNKLIAEIHHNITSGFSSADANIDYLKDPSHDKYFTVYCPTEVSEFTTLQQRKFFILYNLYVERYKESKKEGAGFFDFVRRFFEDKDPLTDTSEALQISLMGGLKFSIHLLTKISEIAPDILKSSLEYLHESFRNASPTALYGINKTFFISDQSINEARNFLNNIVQTQSDTKVRELALKLILVIGIMRANVEDFVLAINLIEQYRFQFDISEEINRISFDIEESALNPRLFQDIEKVKQNAVIFYLQSIISPVEKCISKNVGFATDGNYFYLHVKKLGLFKIGCGESGDQMLGKVYAHKSYRINEKCKLVCMNGQLLCRSQFQRNQALFVIDPVTLEEAKELVTFEKGQLITLEWKDDKENNRFMGVSPLFTDSNFLYAISHKRSDKDDDEEEEKEDQQISEPTHVRAPAGQVSLFGAPSQPVIGGDAAVNNPVEEIKKKNKDDFTNYQYVLEIYEMSITDNKLKIIKQIPLLKDKENALIKPKYILKRASFVTNGKIMLMISKRKMHFFDLATGIRLHKTPLQDELTSAQDGTVTYDVLNHRLWYLNNKDKELYSFICPNFKRVVKEESEFQLQYLKKRINAIRKKALPEIKNVKEKQMDNVLTALGIQSIKSVTKEEGAQPFEEATINENKFLIMSLLSESSNNLERERPQINWNPKKYEEATKRLLSQFKSPFSTNLTPYFFTKLSQLLCSFINLIDAPKTTKTLEQQYSFYFTLKLLKSNLISLTVCEIDLKDIIQDESIYNEFYQSFKNTVVTIIEKGFNKDYQNQEIKLLWKEIYDECLLSMSMGLGMIYNSFKDINQILKKSLTDLSDPKNQEYALLVITNFARHETIRKLINSEENLTELFTLFKDIINIPNDEALKALNKTEFPNNYCDITKTDLQLAAFQFIYRFCEKFLVFYTEYKDNQLQQKKYMERFMIIIVELLTQQCSRITEAVKNLLTRFYVYLKQQSNQDNSKHKEVMCKQYCQKIITEETNSLQLLSLYVSAFSIMDIDASVMSPISNSIISFIEILCEFTTEVNAREKTMDQVLKPTFIVESSHPYVFELKQPVLISCKGAESFKVQYSSKSKFPPLDFMKAIRVVNSSTQVDLYRISSDSTNYSVQTFESKDSIDIHFEYADIKKQKLEYLLGHPAPECYGFKLEVTPSFGSELLTLNNFLDQILRSSSWLIGRFSYSLMKIKKIEKESEEEKNYKLLLQSKIFSGGFEHRFLHLYSKKTIKKLQELIEITKDFTLKSHFSNEGVLIDNQIYHDSKEDEILLQILNVKQDHHIDSFIEFLQKEFSKTVMWGNVGSKIGEQMVRAAFAPLIKFSNLAGDFKILSDQYQLEISLISSDDEQNQLTQSEKEQIIKSALLENPSFDQIQKRWALASRMRTFYHDMKKSISDAVEKRRQKQMLADNSKNSANQVIVEEEISMIDTSSNQELHLERTISQEDHDKLEKDIQQITHKIVERSEFLLRLTTPQSWESTILQEQEILESQVEDDDWSKRLDKWREIQESKGIIKSMELVAPQSKILDSMVSSILSCVQSAIHMKQLKKQVEIVYVQATQRVAGLKLISILMRLNLPHSFDLINWFCSAIRGNSNNLSHYLDDIRGCGHVLESKARESFFIIIEGLLIKLAKSRDETEIRQILNSLRWDYNASDHSVLEKLKIFTLLRDSSDKLKALWGTKFKYEFIFKDAPVQGQAKSKEQDRKDDFALLNKVELNREIIDLFETILVSSLGKSFSSLEHNITTTIKLKDQAKKGLMLPNLEKFQQVLNVEQTLKLLTQGYDIVFRELQVFTDFGQKFDGISWKVFVRLMNRFRKTGTYIKPDNIQDSATSIEAAAYSLSRMFAAAVVPDEGGEYGNEGYGEEEYEGGEYIDVEADQSNLERIKEHTELVKFQEFYNIHFTQRLLTLVTLLSSVSTKNAFASTVLFRIAHPQRIATLISILCLGNPQIKIIVIKILEHLTLILPPDLFEKSVDIMTAQPNSYQSELLNKVKTKSKIGSSNKFTKLLFNYLISIRNKIWARKFESQGMYGVSTGIVVLLRKMFETTVWRYLHEAELKASIYAINDLSFQEKDAVMSIFGGDLQGLSTGNIAIDKNENKITLLGFSDQWIDDQEDQAKKNLKVPKTSLNFEQKTNKAIGLYINETSIDNNEVMILDPQELVLVDLSSKKSQLPIKDLLMDKDLMRSLIQEGIINLSKQSSDKMTIEELNYKISITKIIFSLLTEREEQFIDFLKQPQMNTLFNDFLNLLFSESCKILKTPITLQFDWVEQKCFEIRKAACESKATLVKLKELCGQVIIDKVFLSYNTNPIDKLYTDYDLVGALNFDNIVDMQMRVGFYNSDEYFKTPEFLVIKSTDLYTENGLKRLAEAEVVLTSDELNIDEYYVFLEKQERKIKGLTEKPIVLIDTSDFDEVVRKFYKDQIHLQTNMETCYDINCEQTEYIEHQAKLVSEWSGLDFGSIHKMLKQGIDSDFSLTSKINSLIKEEQKKTEERKKKLEEEAQALKLKKVQAAVDNEVIMIDTSSVDVPQVEELKSSIFIEEPVKYKEVDVKKKADKDQKDREEMISIVMDLVQEDTAQVMKFELKERKKLEQQTAEALFKSVKGFSESSAYTEYQQSLDLLFTLYSRRILQKILTVKFDESLALMLNSPERKKQFKQFLKIISNEAIFVKFNTRSKKQIKSIDDLLKRIVIKCKSEPQFQGFIEELFQEDVMKATKDLIKYLRGEKLKSVRIQFSSEEKATKYSNPYFVLAISKIFLEHCQDDLLKEDHLQQIIEQFLTLAYLFNKDPELKVKINEFILNILEAVQRNYSRLPFKLKEQLQQMWMFKSIVEKYNFNASANDTVYQRHHLLLLEILMKLLHLKKLSKKEIHSIYSKNETLLQIQRAKDILKETNQYKLLMYLIHFNKLSVEQRTVKKSFESAHKVFDTKVTAQFRIEEIEKMTLMFDEMTEIEPDTAVAITRDYEGKEILQVLFADEIARKSLDIFDENVFIHYPCRPSTIFAFGDCYHGKLGIDMAQGQFETPTIIKKVLAKVKDIQSFNNALVIQLNDGTLYRGGHKEYWNAADKQTIKKWDKKASVFALGTRHTLIVNEKGQIQGEGVSNAGGMGTEVYENKSWTTIKISTKEKITQLSCGYDFSFAITEQGQLFCAGNNMLSKLNITNLNKFEKIDLGQGVFALKVASGYSVMGLVLVKNSGVDELWSGGYNSKGALGSGDNVQTKSVFSRVAYDANAIRFIDVDVYQDHAAAITDDGQLYQWGFNAHGRCGIRDRDKNIFPPQFWEPKKVEYFNEYFVKQVAVGQGHTVLIAAPRQNLSQNKVFAFGREDNNGHHLACTPAEAQKDDDFIKHIKRFDHLKVYKVEAGAKCTFVCCEGEEDLLTSRYEHKQATCHICKDAKFITGPLHFTVKENKFTYYCQSCVLNNKNSIPKICIALKAQVEDIEDKQWPHLSLIEEKLVEANREYTCDFTKQRFSSESTPVYLSQSKLNESGVEEYCLSEESFMQANSNDINPIIYIRIAQGFSLQEILPAFDLRNYYKSQTFYGLRLNLSPDFQYTINHNILQDTQDQYQSYSEEMKKFDPKLDEDLYKFIEDYCYQNREVQLKDINPLAIEIDERRFSDKAKKLPEAIKRKRLQILLDFNKFASQLVPFIDYNTKLSLEASARLNAYFMKAKEFIMYQVKYRYQTAYVNNLEVSADKKDIPINRLRSLRFMDSGKVDHTGEYTVFGQCYKALQAKKYLPMLVNNSTDRAWNSKFIGEGSIDVGGPYRETFFEMCKELQSHALPLLLATSNHKNDFGEHRDKWIPSPSATSPTHIKMFEFVGALIGMSIRCSQILNLNFPSLFWKSLIDEPLDRSDLNMVDSYCLQMLDGIKNLSQTLPEREFQEYHDQKFVTSLSDGNEVELVPGGKNRVLTKDNADEFVQLVMAKRLNESEKQMRAIKAGIGMVFPQFLMKLYTWKELEYKVCGKPSIDLHHLRAISKYNGCTEDDETCKRFWRVLENFSDEEKSLYLKFVWGRSRLPLVDEKFGDKHTIKLITPPNCDQSLPIAHTCFFAIDVPRYSTEEIMRDKFLYAIKFCQAIDTDGSPYEILGEQSDEDF